MSDIKPDALSLPAIKRFTSRFSYQYTGMKYLLYIATFSFLFINGIFGQTIPEKPTLYNVTIDPESGNAIINWYPTPSIGFIEYYIVGESQVPLPGQPPDMLAISFPIDKDETSYIITTGDYHSRSVGYSVWAVNDIGGGTIFQSLYDEPDSTVYLEAVYDSCQATITLSWNDYNTWRGSIVEYNIYRRFGPEIYQKFNTLNEGTNQLVINQVDANQTYDLFVEVVNLDGRKSTSNRVTVFTKMSANPNYINADFATISAGNHIGLSFTPETVPGTSKYNILRSRSFDGPYATIGSLNASDAPVSYVDEVPFTSAVYFYKLQYVNKCGNAITESNVANNIILNGHMSGNSVSLTWNEYVDWLGGVSDYQITREAGKSNPVTEIFDQSGVITTYTDNLDPLVNYENPQEGLVCYTIRARENVNSHGISGTSESNRVCFSINPDIRIPDAVIPNDPEPVNQVFEPVFSFMPEHYEISIYNRLGTKIWEGSEPWNGKVNGKYVPEGVYVYYLRVFSYSANVKDFNGKLTVLYR